MRRQTPVILTCAVTGSADTPSKNPAVPVTPDDIAASCLAAADAGAAIVHIHVRDPQTGKASMAPHLYRAVTEQIRAANPHLILNLTGGPGGRFRPSDSDPRIADPASTLKPPAERVRHIGELKPDICSIDVVTMNRRGFVSMNTEDHLMEMAEIIKAAGSKPEIEVFDTGNIPLATKDRRRDRV